MNSNAIAGPRQFSVADAALYLEMHPQTVYDLAARKQIRSRRKGPKKGRLYFFQCDLDAYLGGVQNSVNLLEARRAG